MFLFRLRGAPLSWATVASCSFAMLLFGYDQGVMRCALPFLKHCGDSSDGTSGLISSRTFDMQIFGTTTPSPSISGVVVAIYEIGAFVGAVSVMAFGMYLCSCAYQ